MSTSSIFRRVAEEHKLQIGLLSEAGHSLLSPISSSQERDRSIKSQAERASSSSLRLSLGERPNAKTVLSD